MRSAIFVEGHTEAVFVRELIKELAGPENVSISEEYLHGSAFVVTYRAPALQVRSHILIANCCNDGKVATAIRDRYLGLVAAGYERIIGLRDLYPLTNNDLQTVKTKVSGIMPVGVAPAEVIIAVAEVESWFIEEETHFLRIDNALTKQAIYNAVGYDIDSGLSESILHPAQMLHDIYQIAGFAYRKTQKQVVRTISALDTVNLYVNSRQRSSSLNEFIMALETLLT